MRRRSTTGRSAVIIGAEECPQVLVRRRLGEDCECLQYLELEPVEAIDGTLHRCPGRRSGSQLRHVRRHRTGQVGSAAKQIGEIVVAALAQVIGEAAAALPRSCA